MIAGEDYIAITNLYNYIMPYLPGIPKVLLDQQIIVTLRHFFDQTQCYQYVSRRITIKPNQTEYVITEYPTGWWPERIYSIREFLNDDDATGTLLVAGYDYVGNMNPVGFTLANIPTAEIKNSLEPTLVLIPEFTATVIPVDIFNRFFEVIAAGVKARCQSQSRMVWTEPQQAVVNQQIYEDGINNARTRVERGWTNKTLFAKPAWRFA